MPKPRGISLVEILVATVIFGVSMVGLMSVFVSGKRNLLHARERAVSVQLAKFFIDPLQMDVKQENWGQAGNIFTAGGTAGPEIINNTSFSATYAVTDVVSSDLKRVITTITWTEPPL